MQLPLFQAYTVMMPRLMARESLRRTAETGVGSGSLQPERSKEILRDWSRDAETESQKTRKATASDLSELPIQVNYVKES